MLVFVVRVVFEVVQGVEVGFEDVEELLEDVVQGVELEL